MRRELIIAAAFLALLCSGTASAFALRTIMLSPGQCTKVHGTKVCARKPAAHTVIQTITQTVTITPVTENYSGKGNMVEPAISTQIPEQLCWTSTWPDGAIINDPNGDFFLSDDAPGGSVLVPQTQAGSGCITLNPGNHELHIIDNDTASWTVKVS